MPQAHNFIKKETLAQLFSCEFCEISKNTFFIEQLWTTASKSWLQSYQNSNKKISAKYFRYEPDTVADLTFQCITLSWHSLVKGQQWKRKNNLKYLLKVNNKGIKTTSLTSFDVVLVLFWCLFYWLWTDSISYFGISIVAFGQVNAGSTGFLFVLKYYSLRKQ